MLHNLERVEGYERRGFAEEEVNQWVLRDAWSAHSIATSQSASRQRTAGGWLPVLHTFQASLWSFHGNFLASLGDKVEGFFLEISISNNLVCHDKAIRRLKLLRLNPAARRRGLEQGLNRGGWRLVAAVESCLIRAGCASHGSGEHPSDLSRLSTIAS